MDCLTLPPYKSTTIMRKLIFLLLLVLAGYVGYLYYFGKGEEKTQARSVVEETGQLIHSVGLLLKNQKDTYNEHEVKSLIDQVNATLQNVKTDSGPRDQQVNDDLRDLTTELRKMDTTRLSVEDKRTLEKLINELEKETH